MNNIADPAPVVSNFLKGIAADLHGHIPGKFSPIEVVAAATESAKKLAGDSPLDRSHYRQAVADYLKKLPEDTAEAILIIKEQAEAVLGIPGLAAEFKKLKNARQALADAEAEVAQAESEQGRHLTRINQLDGEIAKATSRIESWQLDFDGIEAQSKATIIEHFGDNSPGAVYTHRQVDAAFADLARVDILRKLAPVAVAKFQATIDEARAELKGLRAETLPMEGADKPKRQKEIQATEATV